MSIDKDDKFEGQEESEYHFSDEEVNYEIDAETPKAAESATVSEPKEDLLKRLANSKRIIGITVVFLILVFIVYKMVGQSTTAPTEITPATTAAQPMPATNQPNPIQQAQTVPPVSPVAPANPASPVQPPAVQQQGLPAPAVNTANTSAQIIQPASDQTQATQQQLIQSSVAPLPSAQTASVVAVLPEVIPVQSSPSSAYGSASTQTVSPSALTSMGAYIDARSAALNATSQKAIDQLQNQYTQQVNEFAVQNKTLQDQIQNLTSKVAVMESQLNQLVQVLTKRSQSQQGLPPSSMNNPAPAPVQIQQGPDVRIAYNVQAIIPGRAWLKSDNGETLTVAEGDVIKDVGRVAKIDPYDGVVEINTGTKSVSLSYGNAG